MSGKRGAALLWETVTTWFCLLLALVPRSRVSESPIAGAYVIGTNCYDPPLHGGIAIEYKSGGVAGNIGFGGAHRFWENYDSRHPLAN